MIALLLVGAVCLVISASYVLYDTDLWQHLIVGKVMWSQGGVPRTNLWTWLDFGQPYFLSSWGFRALAWPLWSWGGVGALFAWRWLSTLAVFGLLFATARTMGARGLSAVLVLVWTSLDYRLRTDVRPETLASLCFAIDLLLLERHRRRVPGAGRQLWGVAAVAWLWANAHISYYLGFALIGFYLMDALWEGWGSKSPEAAAARSRAGSLARIALVGAAISFVNPFGWVALWQPFQFALFWRNDPLVRTIGELQPLTWSLFISNGMFLWPLLILARAVRRRGWDRVEIAACLFFSAIAINSLRFVATYALIAGPFMARDLEDVIASRRWPVPRLPLPARAALVAALAVALCLPDWLRPDLPLGIRLDPTSYPEKACDFMEAHAIRGRIFNHLQLGGYLPYRFWPERDRLPFMSTQPEYSRPEERRGYIAALLSPEAWAELDGRHQFEIVLVQREQSAPDSLHEFLDRDPRWAMVFSDDAAELLVRRDGRHAAVADAFGYRVIPAGRARRYELVAACERDPALRGLASAELDRMIASSPQNGSAAHLRGLFALMDGDLGLARRHLERAIALKPLLPSVHQLLGNIARAERRPRDAIREFAAERRLHDPPPGIFFQTAEAYRAAGDLGRARAFYRRELQRDPGSPARDSLHALESRAGG